LLFLVGVLDCKVNLRYEPFFLSIEETLYNH
jgi:hypothetical protein